MRRVVPALVLIFLSPLVAEFILGDFPVTYLPMLFGLAPMYGGGALLIREVTRRAHRGWPTMALLALAFGVIEEGLVTQSLFNPNYANAHLLEKGFVPSLGIAIPWTIVVLSLHTVWSISTPVALVEESTGARRTTPWLRTLGLTATAVLFVAGCALIAFGTYSDGHFTASPAQLTVSALVAAALGAAAFLLPRRSIVSPRPAPSPWLLLAGVLAAGVLFMVADALPAGPGVGLMVLILATAAAAILTLSRRAGWGPWHRFALAAGALLTYAWHAFTMSPVKGGTATLNLVSHLIFALVTLMILGYAAMRVRRRSSPVDLGR